MSEENKAIVRRFYEAINNGDLDAMSGLIADNMVEHEVIPGLPPTKEGTLEFFKAVRSAFPDFKMTVDDLLAEGDKVFVLVTATGTQQGEFMGIPASGKKVAVPVADLLRIENGKAAEHWGVMDNGALMQQLGVAG